VIDRPVLDSENGTLADNTFILGGGTVEHRKDKRFGERDRVIIRDAGRPPAHPTKHAINAYTYDLSLTGARIGSKKEFAVGAIVHIVIDLERSEQFLKVDGRVVWAQPGPGDEPFEIGVQFLHSIPDTILALIRHFYGKGVGIPSLIS
jgi:Tfp pilus assembly protein PilZ